MKILYASEDEKVTVGTDGTLTIEAGSGAAKADGAEAIGAGSSAGADAGIAIPDVDME